MITLGRYLKTSFSNTPVIPTTTAVKVKGPLPSPTMVKDVREKI
jgi:hypothetical protein